MVVGGIKKKEKKEYFVTRKIYMKFKFQCVNSFTGNEKKNKSKRVRQTGDMIINNTDIGEHRLPDLEHQK